MSDELGLWLLSLVIIVPAFLYAYIAVRDANKREQKEKKS